ncbi:MAG: NUDIX domain-containing protein [Candidatus Heimdallarchaeota archaeon]|nr:NUDIX domain-containing protein [Candidatus Heimdallarchaeota archaeon]
MEKNAFFLAGAAILAVQDNKFLLGKRSETKDSRGGIWEFPSGRLQQDESPEYGLIREGKEELDVLIRPIQLIDAYTLKRVEHTLILLSYYCKLEGEIKISHEHSELTWVNYDQALNLLKFEKQRNTLKKLKNYLILISN